ncbi:nitrilase-related carbon-nitrogen hydrolase [Marinicrinis sediminis]|uniref:Nitrilase-related carbon-nitrogen hydrolase n=1 Tax=Marinicrinis sediminis TaxID=1652465 RepID=A0ABW5RCB5_9BACL
MKTYQSIILMLLGGVLMALSNGKFLLAPAAWIFPVLFLFAIRDMRMRTAWMALTLMTAVSNQISFHGMLPSLPDIPMFGYIPAMAGALYAIPFMLQKWSYTRTQAFAATLILPCTYALLDEMNVYANPFGAFGIPGYSQHDFLAFVQVASVLGVTGLTFIMLWAASILYWLHLNHSAATRKTVFLIASGVLGLIILWGGLRLTLDSGTETVAVSGIHTLDRTDSETLQIFDMHLQDPHAFLQEAEKRMVQLLELTAAEAQSGAKLIHHAEASVVLDHSQKSGYLERLGEVARTWKVYIVTVPYVFTPDGEPNENVLYIIGPSGDVELEHYKYGGNMIERTVEGDKQIQYVDTPYGRLSGVICWDKDFPSVMRQVGEQEIDLLFIPSADWKEIAPYHTWIGHFRGVENGANVITQTVNGMSAMADYKGQTWAKMDHFTTDHWVMSGHIPTRGTDTFYTDWGKYFTGCIIIALIVLIRLIFIQSKDRMRKEQE